MRKLVKPSLLLVILCMLQTQAFAFAIDCKFTSKPVTGIDSIQLTEEALFINGQLAIALEKTKIRCGALGTRDRYEGLENGFQVVLKDCSPDDRLEGHLVDAVKQEIADIECK